MALDRDSLFQILDDIAPPYLAESWDHVGPQIIPTADAEVRAVIVCLDCTRSVLEEASACGADLIIAHHPLIFTPMDKLIHGRYPCNLIFDIIRIGIGLFVMHTNLDKAAGGINDRLAHLVGLKDVSPLVPHPGHEQESGLGRIGMLARPTKLSLMCEDLRKQLAPSSLRMVGSADALVQRIAVCSGSGASLIHEAIDCGADALLTGDVKYHQAMEAQGLGMALIDAGHFATERIVVPLLKERLEKIMSEREQGKDVVIHTSRSQQDPLREAP